MITRGRTEDYEALRSTHADRCLETAFSLHDLAYTLLCLIEGSSRSCRNSIFDSSSADHLSSWSLCKDRLGVDDLLVEANHYSVHRMRLVQSHADTERRERDGLFRTKWLTAMSRNKY